MHGEDALDELDRLAEVCDPATKVIVVGRTNDVELYRELMRRGASEYLVAPLSPLQLIEVISGLYLDPGATPDRPRRGRGRRARRRGLFHPVAQYRLVHRRGTAHQHHHRGSRPAVRHRRAWISTTKPARASADALSAPERLDDVLLDRLLLKRGEHLSLFTAPAALERDYDAVPESYEAVIDAVRQTTPCVILDLPHGWTPWIKAALLAADDVVIVATPDLTSLRNAKNIIELVKNARPNDTPPRLVINQVGMPKRPEIPVQGFRRDHGHRSLRHHRLRAGPVRPGRQQRPDGDRTGAQGAGIRSRCAGCAAR